MTGNKVQVLINRLGKQIPPNTLFEFKSKLLEAEEEDYDLILKCPLDSTIATILFAMFLGGLGIDRFYILDISLGVGKLVANLASQILLSIAVFAGALWFLIIAILIWLAVVSWQIADIFISYKKCRYKNFVKLMRLLLDKKGRMLDDTIIEIISA